MSSGDSGTLLEAAVTFAPMQFSCSHLESGRSFHRKAVDSEDNIRQRESRNSRHGSHFKSVLQLSESPANMAIPTQTPTRTGDAQNIAAGDRWATTFLSPVTAPISAKTDH